MNSLLTPIQILFHTKSTKQSFDKVQCPVLLGALEVLEI